MMYPEQVSEAFPILRLPTEAFDQRLCSFLYNQERTLTECPPLRMFFRKCWLGEGSYARDVRYVEQLTISTLWC
jgi:hypothetical protein